MAKEFSRRKFLQQSARGSLLAASVGSIWAEVEKAKAAKSQSVLTKAYRENLLVAADEIIPAVEGMPAASQVGAVDYIEIVLVRVPRLKKEVHTALTRLENNAQSRFKRPFSKLASDDRVNVLKAFEAELEQSGSGEALYGSGRADFFAVLRDLVYEAYYTSPKVWPLLGYKFHATNDAGPDMKPFDEAILVEIRKRPRNYREVT
jgi:hypothetical protein